MKKTILTTSAGAPIADDNNSISVGPRGPLTFDNFRLIEKLANFNRERIPERVVYACGTGAYGTFILEKDLSEYSIADFLSNTGKKTSLFVRFSNMIGGQNSCDYARDIRGFAIKFYTRQGNFDLVGSNSPVFFLNDPNKFPDFIHSQKNNPHTNLPNPAAMYEFWANHPQSLHQLTLLMSDRGIPYSYRHMHGYGAHTMSLWNQTGQRFWIKWHIKSNQGIRCLTHHEALNKDPSGAQRDLITSIEQGNLPSWSVQLQIMPEADASHYMINPFDVTKIWPHKDYPLIHIGTLELNANVESYFCEIEQAAFAPSNLVPGIGISPDKVLQARAIAYQDAHRYRVGSNANQLPINKPCCPVNDYQQDYALADHRNKPDTMNFYPNDQMDECAPQPDAQYTEPAFHIYADTSVKAHSHDHNDYYSQAGALFQLMAKAEQDRLASNIAEGLVHASDSIQKRMLVQFSKADPYYANGVYLALQAKRSALPRPPEESPVQRDITHASECQLRSTGTDAG